MIIASDLLRFSEDFFECYLQIPVPPGRGDSKVDNLLGGADCAAIRGRSVADLLHPSTTLCDMGQKNPEEVGSGKMQRGSSPLLWLSGAWTLPLLALALWLVPDSLPTRAIAIAAAVLFSPLPMFLYLRRRNSELQAGAAASQERSAQLQLELETVRYRTARLREDLQAADRQARLGHQLALLGQFTAGFMHEFNNPLAIVEGRLEVLLEERKTDTSLCVDLEQMLKEARYMGKIARTLLQALRRERGTEVYDPAQPQKAVEAALLRFRDEAWKQGVELIEGFNDVPRVDVPEHVIVEVIRGLIGNSLRALEGREHGQIRVSVEPYQTAGGRVSLRIEDNGPGVPEQIREHLFEPFVSQSSGRERLGLGLFLAASLLDMYDGRIHYESRDNRGACFVIELPPARFTRGQPYHWFSAGGRGEPYRGD